MGLGEAMNEKTLVVMAAGMGSRFGGLKQIEPVGPSGEFILDYSVYDAKLAGFNRVVFIIKEENYSLFKETVGKRIERKMKVEYAFQKNDDVPQGTMIPNDRMKPLGTAHALYCVRNFIRGAFAVISADDFYGREAFQRLSEFLDYSDDYGVVGYQIGSTLSPNDSVKRGVIFNCGSDIDSILESKVERVSNKIIGVSLDGKEEFEVLDSHPVSMLMYALQMNIFPYIEKNMPQFFANSLDRYNAEYLLPIVLNEMHHKNNVKLKLIPTDAKWIGVTYKEDLEVFKKYLEGLILKGEYPKNLWE